MSLQSIFSKYLFQEPSLVTKWSVYVGGILVLILPIIPFNFISDVSLFGIQISNLRFIPFLIALILLMLWYASRQNGDTQEYYHTASNYIFFFGISSLIGALLSENSLSSVGKTLYYFLTGDFLLIVIVTSFKQREHTFFIILMLIIGALVVGFYGLLEVWGDVNWLRNIFFSRDNDLVVNFIGMVANQDTEITVSLDRAISTIGNPNPLGTYLAMVSPLFFAYFFSNNHLRKIIGLCGTIISLILIQQTYSRGALVSASCAFCWYFWSTKRTYLIIAVSVMGFLGLLSYQNDLMSKKTPLAEISSLGTQHRVKSWVYALEIWGNYPLFGVGTGNYKYYARPMGSQLDVPDNMYLTMLAENGIVGVATRLGLFVLIIQSFKLGRKELNEQDKIWANAAFAGVIAGVLNMLTWDVLNFPVTRTIFWVMVGLLIVLSCKKQ